MRNKIRIATLIIVTLLSSGVEAAAIWCSGKISSTYVDASGSLITTSAWRGDYTMLCNIRSAWKGIDPTVCLSWMGIALTAASKQQSVTIQYTDPAAVACNTLETYAGAPPPVYLMLNP